MNERIEKAYAQRPKRWVFELSVAVIVTALIVWSATAVETSGTTQNGGKIALNILSGIFHPDTGLLFNLTVQGVPYLLLETVCIAGVSLRVQPDAEAHCFYRPHHHYGRAHGARVHLWADVHPCHGTGRFRGPADDVAVLCGHGEQNVY